MSPEEVRRIAEESIAMDLQEHTEDHRWTRTKREGEAELARLKRKILASACIYAVPLILGFILVSVWHEFVAKLAAVLK
jgi:hypothetical protein